MTNLLCVTIILLQMGGDVCLKIFKNLLHMHFMYPDDLRLASVPAVFSLIEAISRVGGWLNIVYLADSSVIWCIHSTHCKLHALFSLYALGFNLSHGSAAPPLGERPSEQSCHSFIARLNQIDLFLSGDIIEAVKNCTLLNARCLMHWDNHYAW